MNQQRGFNLLECLLALVVIAAVLLMSIQRYHRYQQHILIANVKSDIASIQNALNRYYHVMGCRVNGKFAGNLTPSLATLGLKRLGRPPLIPLGHAYQTTIIDTKQKDQQGNDLYLYALQVTANFSSSLSVQQMRWYENILGAKYVKSNNRLVWITMPSSMASVSDHGKELWVMNAQGEQFRRMENQQWKKITGHADPNYPNDPNNQFGSPSYCAH